MRTIDLFSLENLATTVHIPRAPKLIPHDWPYPGLTAEDSARSGLAMSEEYADMLAAVIYSQAPAVLTSKQVLALIPSEWRALLGRFSHGSLSWTCCEKRAIRSNYVAHDDGGFHFTFQALEFGMGGVSC